MLAHGDSQAIQNGPNNLDTFSPWNTAYDVSHKCRMNKIAFCSGRLFCLNMVKKADPLPPISVNLTSNMEKAEGGVRLSSEGKSEILKKDADVTAFMCCQS